MRWRQPSLCASTKPTTVALLAQLLEIYCLALFIVKRELTYEDIRIYILKMSYSTI